MARPSWRAEFREDTTLHDRGRLPFGTAPEPAMARRYAEAELTDGAPTVSPGVESDALPGN